MVCSGVKVDGFDMPTWRIERISGKTTHSSRHHEVPIGADVTVPIRWSSGSPAGLKWTHRAPTSVCFTAPLRTAHRTMFLQFDGNGALYAQLARALKRAILQGQLKAGAALPATRTLAAELGLSRNTVLTAYEMLRAEQLAVARVGSGTFVSASTASGDRPPIKAKVPAQTRYAARLRSLPALTLRSVAPRLRYDLHYGEPLVDPPLVTAWRRELARAASGRRLGLPAKRRPAGPAPGHQRISRTAARRRVPRRRRRRRQRARSRRSPCSPAC